MVGGDYYDVIRCPTADTCSPWPTSRARACRRPAARRPARRRADRGARPRLTDELVAVVDRLDQMIFRDTSEQHLRDDGARRCSIPSSPRLTYCNASHVHPLLCHANGARGVARHRWLLPGHHARAAPTRQATVELTPGAVLTMYSDGVTDTMNEAQELFGLQAPDRRPGITRGEESAEADLPPAGRAGGRLPQKRRAVRRLHAAGAEKRRGIRRYRAPAPDFAFRRAATSQAPAASNASNVTARPKPEPLGHIVEG